VIGDADIAIVVLDIRNWSLHDEDEDEDDQIIVPGDSIVRLYANPNIRRQVVLFHTSTGLDSALGSRCIMR